VAEVTCGELPLIHADRARVTVLFQQLLSNSVRFRRPDVPLSIRIEARRAGPEQWEFSVRDNGLGFDPRHEEAVFTPFRKLHGHNVSGAGLGLAICRKIVEIHGGRIRAEARAHDGVTIWFTLPAATVL
jgi:signal transduction histidine kinase